jgi:hypothetical protein
MSVAPLAAYARWQAMDLLPRLATPIAVFLGIGLIPIMALSGRVGLEALQTVGSSANRDALRAYANIMPLCMTLGAIVVANGFMSTDRERQYVRFLFSNPVVPWQYYLQQFVLAVLLFGASMMLIPLGVGLLVSPVPVGAVGVSALLFALLYGSLAMLCSAAFNRDGIPFLSIAVLTNALHDNARLLPDWGLALLKGLPPTNDAETVRQSLLTGSPVDTGDFIHVLSYSLGMLIVALVIVRRAPLAR